MRFFRAGEQTWESMRAYLDAAWGYPTPVGTQTCYPPYADATKDDQGRAYLGVNAEWANYEAVAAALPDLLASGAVEEISEADFFAVVSPQ
jgi:hypothetical protein